MRTLCFRYSMVALMSLLLAGAGPLLAQDPLDLLKRDAGEWKAVMKFWADPDAEPEVMNGSESNRMIGDYWLVSDFKIDFMGSPFEGHGTFGYDPDSKKYVGFWIDSMSPHGMHMVGTWDEAKQTVTYEGEGKDPSGEPIKSRLTTTYKGKDSHVMTMYQFFDGQPVRMMEVTYTRAK